MDNDMQMNTLVNEAVDKMKEALEPFDDFDGKAILLFSGGRDSSIVANAFCQAFPQGHLHLLFIDNGVLNDKEAPFKQYELIKKLNPDSNIIFDTRQVKKLMNFAAMQEIEKDFTQHKFSTLLVCVACKLIMAYTASMYAKENNIKLILDGFADRQNQFPEQTETFRNAQKDILSAEGLQYVSPLYDFLDDRNKIIDTLQEFGIEDKQEASCMFAHCFSEAIDTEISQHITKTIPLIKEFLNQNDIS